MVLDCLSMFLCASMCVSLQWWNEQVCWGNNDVKRSEHFNEMEGRYIKIHIIIIIIQCNNVSFNYDRQISLSSLHFKYPKLL